MVYHGDIMRPQPVVAGLDGGVLGMAYCVYEHE